MATNTKIDRNGKTYEYYRITRTIGHKIEQGVKKPIKKQFVGTSKRDAEKKYQLWLEENKAKRPSKQPDTNFGELADYYRDNILAVNSKYSIGTRELYTRAYNYHVRTNIIAYQTINTLIQDDIQQFYNSLNISKSALSNVHKFLRGFFDWASRNGYCENIIVGIVIPEKKENKVSEDIIVWTDEELENINAAEPGYYLKGLILFAEYSGMRISELFGLRWSDIKENIIHVRRQSYRGSFIPPKGNKEREIPLHAKLKEYVDSTEHTHELMFCTKLGHSLDYNNVHRSLERFYRRNGIGHKKFHAYRATFCTNLCKKGVPIQIASKLMGHENIMITAKYYTSIDKESMAEAISKI